MTNKLLSIVVAHRTSALLFLFIGGLTAALNFFLFNLCWQVLAINYQVAVVISYSLSLMFHFTANKFFTFKQLETTTSGQVKRYIIMASINLIISFLTVRFTVEAIHLSPNIGIACSIILTVMAGYLLSRFWVFPNRST